MVLQALLITTSTQRHCFKGREERNEKAIYAKIGMRTSNLYPFGKQSVTDGFGK